MSVQFCREFECQGSAITKVHFIVSSTMLIGTMLDQGSKVFMHHAQTDKKKHTDVVNVTDMFCDCWHVHADVNTTHTSSLFQFRAKLARLC